MIHKPQFSLKQSQNDIITFFLYYYALSYVCLSGYIILMFFCYFGYIYCFMFTVLDKTKRWNNKKNKLVVSSSLR